jgi:hypothetical protein
MKIKNEIEVLNALEIPSIPIKEWDGKHSFKTGVAVVNLITGEKAFAIAKFDAENDKQPNIKRSFSIEPFDKIEKIFVVPDYMDKSGVESWDLDDESKAAAKAIINEADNYTEEESIENENEYYFDNIHSDEEAIAFIKSYNRRNRIKGKIPTQHENIIMRLSAIWSQQKNKKI